MGVQYFAQLDENNIVLTVHVVTAEFMAENPERYVGTWVETFIDDPNKQYASVGFTYDFNTENFIAPPAIQPDIEA